MTLTDEELHTQRMADLDARLRATADVVATVLAKHTVATITRDPDARMVVLTWPDARCRIHFSIQEA